MSRIGSNKGMTLIETIVAMSISLLAMMSLAWTMTELGKNKVKIEAISDISALESALTEELQNESYYDNAAIKSSLRAGVVPASLEFNINGSSMGKTFNFNIKPAESISFTKAFAVCTTFPNDPCRYKVDLSLNRDASGRWGFAYRLSTSTLSFPPGVNVALNYRGSGSGASDFAAIDFALTIPFEYYLSTRTLACDPLTTLGVSGIDRERGLVSCIASPAQACANGTLPKAIRSVKVGGQNRVEFDCGAPALQTTCPTHYALLEIQTQSLDPAQPRGRQKVGRCVHIGAFSGRWRTTFSGDRVYGKVCPDGYRSVSTCRLTNIQQRNGSCSPWCNSSNCTGNSVVENPAGTYTRTLTYSCADNTPLTMPPNPGAVRGGFPGGAVNRGDQVDCRVHYAQQDCGATWTAQVSVDVRCELTRTETVSVQ